MIKNSLILLILLIGCTPEKKLDSIIENKTDIESRGGDILGKITIVAKNDWKYIPCNGNTPNCGRLE